MVRKARAEVEGGLYHVITRGINGGIYYVDAELIEERRINIASRFAKAELKCSRVSSVSSTVSSKLT